jgi:splicing factor 45
MPTTTTTIAGFGASSGVVDEQREVLDLKTAGPPSKVIVLRNVVPPGAVDESLDEEIGLECSKYGEVTRYVFVIFLYSDTLF